MDEVEKIAGTVLYEGYLLWPYRRSAIKNQKRWTFGGVYPRTFSENARNGDPWQMQTQCLVAGHDPSIAVKVKFLQAVDRKIARRNQERGLDFVDALQVGSEHYLAWEEARERELKVDFIKLSHLALPKRVELLIPCGREQQEVLSPDGESAGALIYAWQSLQGGVEIGAETVQENVYRVTIRITNVTPWSGQDREKALKQALLSTHTILQVEDGEFISLTDPPDSLEEEAKDCQNLHTWPVLAGKSGEKRYLLSSPIILPDYPQVAPESPIVLFDSTEVDQLLFLNILALTDEEKQEIRATDPRAREILEKTESLAMDDFMQLHGTIREFRTLREQPGLPTVFESLEAAVPASVIMDGLEIRKGSKVQLTPRPGGDIWDIALAGKVAFVEAIEQDFDGRIHLAVTLEDDPGRDLGEARLIGHRFFFSPEEVKPIRETKTLHRKE